jgi:xanthine dehydrogenase iron-sulfur cluster and FAD-binding subunit A
MNNPSPHWQEYYSVTTLEEALGLLDRFQERARIIAGGTDILIELDRHQRQPLAALIDITRIPDLDTITLEDGLIKLGAMTTHNQVVGSKEARQFALPLVQACWEVGAPQIRNRATVAGNVITGSPANDTITPLMALHASVTLRSRKGERIVPLHEFYVGLRGSVMRPDEMLKSINIPMMQGSQRGIFLKLGLRRAQAISVVNVACVLTLENDLITDAVMTFGSVAPTIVREVKTEQYLIGKSLTPQTIAEAAAIAGTVPKPISDVRSTAAYRTEMVRVLVSRALKALTASAPDARVPSWPAMLWGSHNGMGGLPHSEIHGNTSTIETTINGEARVFTSGQHKSLLNFLRDEAGLTGTKEGCAEGECGACTVFLDAAAVMSCLVSAPRAHHANITTIEGLSVGEQLHPIQQTFVDEGAVQCGYCTPGFLMAGAKLLEEHPQPSHEQIQQSISGNLCRCTGYYKIVEAIAAAAQKNSKLEKERPL